MTEGLLNSSRDILTNISERLLALEQQIDQNEVDLVEARNLTTVAQQVASEVQNVRLETVAIAQKCPTLNAHCNAANTDIR